jgi:hypothetical protein
MKMPKGAAALRMSTIMLPAVVFVDALHVS